MKAITCADWQTEDGACGASYGRLDQSHATALPRLEDCKHAVRILQH